MDLPRQILERVDRGLDIAGAYVNAYSHMVASQFPVTPQNPSGQYVRVKAGFTSEEEGGQKHGT